MKKLIVIILLIFYVQSNAQTIIFTFTGENISDTSELKIDSVYIQNKNNDCDTILVGNYFSFTVSSILNRNQNKNDIITSYPNPFTRDIDILIRTLTNSNLHISAYSIDGRRIANWSGKSSAVENKFNFRSGVEGIIFLNVRINGEQFSTKIICREKSGQSIIKPCSASFIDPSNQIHLKTATLRNSNFKFSLGDTLKIIGYYYSIPSLEIADVPLENKNYSCFFDLGGYPTRLFKLDSAELSQLNAESPYELDAYGLFWRTSLFPGGYSSINNADSVVELATNTLINYSLFSNVTSDSVLILHSVKRFSGPGTFNYWDVIFKNQIYNSLEILNTQIFLRVMDTVACIDRHHFKNIFIPEVGLLPIDTIKAKIIGKTIEYYDWGGIQEKIITYNSIVDDFIKKIYWVDKKDFIEFRVVWQIPILYNENSDDDYVGWYIYVDILSGEILYIYQTFIAK